MDGGGETSGLTPYRVDDILLVADDPTRETVGRSLDIRFNRLKHRSPPFTHCGLVAPGNRGSLNIDQGCYVVGMGSLGQIKKISQAIRQWARAPLIGFVMRGDSPLMSHMALGRMLRQGLGSWPPA